MSGLVIPFEREVDALDGAAAIFNQRPDCGFQVSLSQNPIQPGTMGHAFKSLTKFVGVKARIGIRQYRCYVKQMEAYEIQRIELRVVSNDHCTYFTGLDS